MGCDIWLYVEKWNEKEGEWEYVDTSYEETRGTYKYYQPSIWPHRNYDVFAILADVRNSHNFIPISQPKGMPECVSDYINKKYEEFGEYGHSHSYFTLKELKEYDWNKTATISGWVDETRYKEWKLGIPPTEYCESIWGKIYQTVSNQEMDFIIDGINPRKEGIKYFTQVKWDKSYRDGFKGFYDKVIPKLQSLSDGDDENVRIVFWFDN